MKSVLDTASFISQQPLLSREVRRRYETGTLDVGAFVDEVLAPFRAPPVAPAGLLRPGADYLPSSQRMRPEIAARFRGLAEDLVVRSTGDPVARRRAMQVVEALLGRMDGEAIPGRRMRDLADSEIVEMYCELVRVATGADDPYATIKREYNERALAHLREIAEIVDTARSFEDRAQIAVNLGIIGNSIDFADPLRQAHLDEHGFDTRHELRQALTLPYVQGLDERPAFLRAIQEAKGNFLFLADNAGEIVFDLPLLRLIQEAGHTVIIAGKSVPCYNDMTTAELQALVRDPRVQGFLRAEPSVMASGTAMIGLDLRRATPELAAAWQTAAIVCAKGQGMVQTLRYAPLARDVFHAVQVKDPAYFHEGVALKPSDALFLHTLPRS